MKMENDKETLDLLFKQRGNFEEYIQGLKNKIRSAEERKQSHDQKLYSAASEYILEVLADSNNQERYGRSNLTYKEIQERVVEEEPKFTESDMREGLFGLLFRTDSKIEERISKHKTGGFRIVKQTTYQLKK
jgi:hypothetical protein